VVILCETYELNDFWYWIGGTTIRSWSKELVPAYNNYLMEYNNWGCLTLIEVI
jgi:hypothetical protein